MKFFGRKSASEKKVAKLLSDIKSKKKKMETLREEIFKMAEKIEKYKLGPNGLQKEEVKKQEPIITTTAELLNKNRIPRPDDQLVEQKEEEVHNEQLRQQEQQRLYNEQLLRQKAFEEQQIIAQEREQQRLYNEQLRAQQLRAQQEEMIMQQLQREQEQIEEPAQIESDELLFKVRMSNDEEIPVSVDRHAANDFYNTMLETIDKGTSIRIGSRILNGRFIKDVTYEE